MKIYTLKKRSIYAGQEYDEFKNFCKKENLQLNATIPRALRFFQKFYFLTKQPKESPTQMKLPLGK